MTDIAIKVPYLSKCCQIYDNPRDRLKQFVAPRFQRLVSLKALFRAQKYPRRIINALGKNDDMFLIDDRIFLTTEIGRIHARVD